MKKIFILLLLNLLLSGSISFGATCYGSIEASKIAQDFNFTEHEYEKFAGKLGLSRQQIKESLDKTKHASNHPTTYPGFYKYWLESFISYFLAFGILISLVLYFRNRNKKFH